MKVTVRYQTQLRRALGVDAEAVEVGPGCRLPDLLAQLTQRHGEQFRRLSAAVLCFLGDKQVAPAQAVPLEEGAVVTLLVPMAGG
jgi:molybdopterin converting factor small subunit